MLTPEQFDDAVMAGAAEGLTARQMAAAIGCHHSKVTRALARLKGKVAAKVPEALPPVNALAPLRSPPPPEVDGDDVLGTVRANLQQSLAVGDSKSVDLWSRILKRLAGVPSADVTPPPEVGWSALNGTQASALGYLVAVATGEQTDDEPELQWWGDLFKRIPERPQVLHPAHVPLPSGAPGGPQFYVPRAEDPVARAVKQLTEGT